MTANVHGHSPHFSDKFGRNKRLFNPPGSHFTLIFKFRDTEIQNISNFDNEL